VAHRNYSRAGSVSRRPPGWTFYSIRQPLGVVAGVTPFNFPAMVPMWMFANALVCANTFVLKPSEKDPSVSLLLADLLRQAGLPDGVFNVLQGDRVAVESLLADPDVQALSFVGSTPVAKAVYEAGTRRRQAGAGARRREEPHGRAARWPTSARPPTPRSPPATARRGALHGGGGGGRRRLGGRHPGRGDRGSGRQAAGRPAADPDSEMGPLISREHRDKVAAYLGSAGADVVVDGRGLTEQPGFFLGPSLVDNVIIDSPLYTDEIFGPVLSVVRVDTYDEAVRLSTTTRTAMARRCSPGTAARRGVSSTTWSAAW